METHPTLPEPLLETARRVDRRPYRQPEARQQLDQAIKTLKRQQREIRELDRDEPPEHWQVRPADQSRFRHAARSAASWIATARAEMKQARAISSGPPSLRSPQLQETSYWESLFQARHALRQAAKVPWPGAPARDSNLNPVHDIAAILETVHPGELEKRTCKICRHAVMTVSLVLWQEHEYESVQCCSDCWDGADEGWIQDILDGEEGSEANSVCYCCEQQHGNRCDIDCCECITDCETAECPDPDSTDPRRHNCYQCQQSYNSVCFHQEYCDADCKLHPQCTYCGQMPWNPEDDLRERLSKFDMLLGENVLTCQECQSSTPGKPSTPAARPRDIYMKLNAVADNFYAPVSTFATAEVAIRAMNLLRSGFNLPDAALPELWALGLNPDDYPAADCLDYEAERRIAAAERNELWNVHGQPPCPPDRRKCVLAAVRATAAAPGPDGPYRRIVQAASLLRNDSWNENLWEQVLQAAAPADRSVLFELRGLMSRHDLTIANDIDQLPAVWVSRKNAAAIQSILVRHQCRHDEDHAVNIASGLLLARGSLNRAREHRLPRI